MIDFMIISTRSTKRGVIEIYPKFKIKKSSDLMIRGGDFYAIWVEERGLWSTDEQDVIRIVDHELDSYAEQNKQRFNSDIRVMHMWDSETGVIDQWHKYCQRQMRDNFHPLDERLIFSNDETKKEDYASKRLPYPLEPGDCPAYEKLISTLYSEDERAKIEWAIGAIVSGESKHIQKFMVLYGSAGTGKSTILNIIQDLFDGYYTTFSSKALGSSNNSFALEAFKTNPLVAIEHDGDLSRIEDNTRLNSLVSHELMTVNEKFKAAYSNKFNCFLFMGTNKPVRITDAKSGLLRRLIDVSPSGNKLKPSEYKTVTKQVKFELGAIACHCRDLYLANPGRYDRYVPTSMLGASNDFYNFMVDCYYDFKTTDGTNLKIAWDLYKAYCDDSNVPYPLSKRVFKEELKNYFDEYQERAYLSDGTRIRHLYSGFRTDKFEESRTNASWEDSKADTSWIELEDSTKSVFDDVCKDCPAQYASDKETPLKKWSDVNTVLSMIDPTRLHYVKVPVNHIVIDFDIPDENGNKSLEANLKAASEWPETYAELSKSGSGVHLHYIYTGDPKMLNRVFKDHVEIKVFTGNSSLRRKLTKCNNRSIATISSNLPLKGDKKLVDVEKITDKRHLINIIKKALRKDVNLAGTKPTVEFIYKILEDAAASGMTYDVSSLYNEILNFAAHSTHHAEYCVELVSKMKLTNGVESENPINDRKEPNIIFYDVEVFPNLFLVNWKRPGTNRLVNRMINPSKSEIAELLKYDLIGFNCRRYDNHMMYARLMGYSNEELYNLSQAIINHGKNCFFGEAYNLSYTDIYDFASSGNKKSLKKLEIEMGNLTQGELLKKGFTEDEIAVIKAGTHHQELGLPWDQPVPEELWVKVAEYCDNDVIATEAAFTYLKADWTARQILADIAGMSVNDTTNSLTTRIIFGREKNPQNEFNYRDLSKPIDILEPGLKSFLEETCPEMMSDLHYGWPNSNKEEIPYTDSSLLPYFPGYKYENGKSTYRGEDVGEGGFAQGVPGMYGNVALLDISSMHPHSIIAEALFGLQYTKAFRDIVEGRVAIKHEDWDAVSQMLDGKLTPYIQKVVDGHMTSKDLANALKTAINSVYGLTSASFTNPFKDTRNIDNIVAKRGALFMIDLKNAVKEQGFEVAHIKTDSIKIPDATPEIIQFVMDFGARYGYSFEHEATYDRMCLVNDAVYIAKYAEADACEAAYGYIPGDNKKKGGKWTATGTQFQIPYVFKTLFSRESIEFGDMCETKSVSTALYLDMNEKLPDISAYEKELDKCDSDYRKGLISDVMRDQLYSEIQPEIAKGHDYHFVGKVGLFCPMKEGTGGGLLMREKDGKYYSATGAKGYRWMESEMVKELGKVDDIDRSFYDKLVNDAIETISMYGDFEWFVSDDPYISDKGVSDANYMPA